MLISDTYRDLNKQLHAQNAHYGTSGHKWARMVDGVARGMDDLLDYGCGKGTLKTALETLNPPYVVHEYDPCMPGYDKAPSAAEMVVCTDVLEHIEPGCLDAVLDDIQRLATKRVFLVVATRPAVKFLADGRNAHLIVENMEWWLPKLRQRWDERHVEEFGGEFVFIGGAR
jgi:hypothetical protein